MEKGNRHDLPRSEFGTGSDEQGGLSGPNGRSGQSDYELGVDYMIKP